MSCDRGLRQTLGTLRRSGLTRRQARRIWARKARVGFSPFRGSLHRMADARAAGERLWPQAEEDVWEGLKRFHLEDDVERTLGLWADSVEPSFVLEARGRREDVLSFARAWKEKYRQEAVAVLYPHPEGTGGALVWEFERSLTDEEWDRLLAPFKELGFGGTVRQDGRVFEFWFENDAQRIRALRHFMIALRKARIQVSMKVSSEEGFEFILV